MKTIKSLMVFSLLGAECAFCGELEKEFANPPAEFEPAASQDASADLYQLKLRSDADGLAGKETVACNRKWPQEASLIKYVARCRYLLRGGKAAQRSDGDFSVTGTDAAISQVCREYSDGTIGYFVACPEKCKRSRVKLSFAGTGKYPEIWDPESGKVAQPARRNERGGRIIVDWEADAGAAVFVMLRPKKSTAKKQKLIEESKIQSANVTGTWNPAPIPGKACKDVKFCFADGSITLSDYAAAVWLDFGKASGIVDVKVNGKRFPVLWKPPYRVNVVDALKLEDTEHTIAPGAAVDMRSPLDVEVKVTGAIDVPVWTFAGE